MNRADFLGNLVHVKRYCVNMSTLSPTHLSLFQVDKLCIKVWRKKTTTLSTCMWGHDASKVGSSSSGSKSGLSLGGRVLKILVLIWNKQNDHLTRVNVVSIRLDGRNTYTMPLKPCIRAILLFLAHKSEWHAAEHHTAAIKTTSNYLLAVGKSKWQ